MPATLSTTTQAPGPVNVVFQKSLLVNAKARCPYFIGSQPASIAEHSGTFTAKWRRYENLTPVTTPLAELTGTLTSPTARDSTSISVTDLTQNVAKYGNLLLLNEEVDLINMNGQALKLSEIMGINAGESLNQLQRNELEDNATQSYTNGASDAAVNTNMTSTIVRKVVNELQVAKAMHWTPMSKGETSIGTAPIRNAFWGICHYDVEEDIRQLSNFRAVETYANQTATENGEFGILNGVRFISTSEGSIDINAGTTGGDAGRADGAGVGADLYSTVIFGKEAVGSLGLSSKHIKETYMSGDKLPAVEMIAHGKGQSGVADAYNEISSLAWKSFHGAKILNSAWIRTIRSSASVL